MITSSGHSEHPVVRWRASNTCYLQEARRQLGNLVAGIGGHGARRSVAGGREVARQQAEEGGVRTGGVQVDAEAGGPGECGEAPHPVCAGTSVDAVDKVLSVLELSRQLGMRYNTAWSLKHNLRQVMKERDDTCPLGG